MLSQTSAIGGGAGPGSIGLVGVVMAIVLLVFVVNEWN
jgi:hypothetical protein